MLTCSDTYPSIISAIDWYADKLNLHPEIYQLGAEAYEEKINQFPYPEIVDMSRYYNEMASWYWLAGNAPKAIAAQRKAIETLKHKKKTSASDLAAFESQLQQYIKESTI